MEWSDKVFLKCCCRYASLYFCCAIEDQDNELITLEIIHRYVELLDKYFGSVRFLFQSRCHRLYLCPLPRLMEFLLHRFASWTLFSTLRRPTSFWMNSCWAGRLRRRPKRTCWRPLSRPTCCKRWGNPPSGGASSLVLLVHFCFFNLHLLSLWWHETERVKVD